MCCFIRTNWWRCPLNKILLNFVTVTTSSLIHFRILQHYKWNYKTKGHKSNFIIFKIILFLLYFISFKEFQALSDAKGCKSKYCPSVAEPRIKQH
jgi:hypothetical protein